MIDANDIAHLRSLLSKATRGPWKAQRHMVLDRTVAMSWLKRNPDITLGSGNDADAELIVAAVNALPMLLDALSSFVPLGDIKES